MDSARDRLIMLQMALVWSRLAEYASKTAARKERVDLQWPASVDGNAQRSIGWRSKIRTRRRWSERRKIGGAKELSAAEPS